MGRLQDLAIKYNNDKWFSHSYIPFYERLFEGREVDRMLEIGIGFEDLMRPFVPKYTHGSGVRMWSEYWPNAMIHACDIRDDAMVRGVPGISTFVADQSKPKSLWRMTDSYWDVIIDDGSHITEHQILSAAVLVPWLMNDGVYIIEDVREPERVADALGGEIHRFNKRPDDCLVVVRR